MKIEFPSLVEDMSFAEYLADPSPTPSVTSSIIRDILTTAPIAVWGKTSRLNPSAVADRKFAFDLGTAAHALFTGSGDPLQVLKYDSFRTKAAREERDAAYAEGKTPVLEKDMDRVSSMAYAAKSYFSNHNQIGEVINSPNLKGEVSIFWNEIGVPCRCRPDLICITENDENDLPVIVHYKTTSYRIVEQNLAKFAASQGWDLIAAHYQAGVHALTGYIPKQYFAIQETESPYLCIGAELHFEFIHIAQNRREQALKMWAKYNKERLWPGHTNDIVLLSAPTWHEFNMVEARDRDIHRGFDISELTERERHLRQKMSEREEFFRSWEEENYG